MDAIHDVLRSLLPFEWAQPFMLNPLLLILILAPLCAAMGVKVVNFRLAFFSDAISHSAFTGVVLGYLLVPWFTHHYPAVPRWDLILPPLSLTFFGVLVGIGITAVRHRSDLSSDTVIGVFFATVIACGILVISRLRLYADFERYLYGYIIAATDADVAVAAGLAVAAVVFFALNFNRLMLAGLNDSLARSRGIRVRLHDYLFSAFLALIVTLSIRTVGLLLVTALLVVPAAAARNIAGSAGGMVWWSALIGLVSGVGGLIVSYYADTSAGATIILLAACAFVLTLAIGAVRDAPGEAGGVSRSPQAS